MKEIIIMLLLIPASLAIIPAQQESPGAEIVSCTGHRVLDRVSYDIRFVNRGETPSNFYIEDTDTVSGNLEPGEEGVLSISYPLPMDEHVHSEKVGVCSGGYLSYKMCAYEWCRYSDDESKDDEELEALFGTEKLEQACAPALMLAAALLSGGFLRRV